jgi:predicted metalloprotease with PDZ domain
VARVRCTQPESHTIEVELTLPALAAARHRELMMPRWIPGSYTLRDYARFVHSLEITTKQGRKIPTTRPATDRWRLRDPATGPLTVRYKVYCRDLTVNHSHVTSTHLYLHGVTVFLWDEDTRERPWRMHLEVPRNWKIWTGLPEHPARKGTRPPELKGSAHFAARDYDHLVDCPIEAGDAHHEERFTAAGKPHRLITWNPGEGIDWKRITKDITRIIEEACTVFDGPPYKDYTFILHLARDHGGGLEHDNSTVLGADPLALTEDKAYHTRFLPLVAHEYFHVWNVRRNKPSVLERIDYQRECPTGLLWFFEGGTTYYEFPLMLRAGIKKEHVYEVLTEIIKAVEYTPGRHRLSVTDASRLSWTKLYKQHESNPNTNISYYSKGALVCLMLDAHLRENGATLDQVMRHIWLEYGKKGRGIEEGSLPRHVQDATGVDVSRQLRAWLEKPGDLPLDKALASLGLKLERKHSDKNKKQGLGVILDEDNLKVLAVPERDLPKDPTPSLLDPGDEILAVDGWKVTAKNLARHLNPAEKRDTAEIAIFRDGRLVTLDVPLVEKNPDNYTLKEDKDAPADAKRRRAAWKRRRATK